MANCKECKHYPMCGFSKYASAEKCLDFWDVSVVVKVVRCKDCKFYHDKGYCTKITGLTRIKPDDFCSYGENGERKDNS